MQKIEMSTCGAITFWSAKACNVDSFRSSMRVLGLDQYVPEPRTDRSALSCAIEDYGKATIPSEQDTLVLPLKKPGVNGFELRSVKRGDLSNDTHHIFSARVDASYVQITHGYADRYDLQGRFDSKKAELTSDAVGKFLVTIAHQHLYGVAVRENGGIYWIPDQNLPMWEQIARAVERETGSVITTGAWEANPQTISVVQERVSAQVEEMCSQILAEIQDGKPHDEEYFDRRKARADGGLIRIEEVERALSVSLLSARACIDLVKNVIMATAIC